MKMRLASLVLAGLTLTAPLAAPLVALATPPPARPGPAQLYSGRWYEVARIPNQLQRDCEGASSDFAAFDGGHFRVVQVCHHGAPTGPAQTFNASGQILPDSNNAKINLSFFGGIVRVEYWILDRAEDGTWAIMGTSNGRYVWLLSRRPVLDATQRDRAIARMAQLGYPVARLQFPAQQAR